MAPGQNDDFPVRTAHAHERQRLQAAAFDGQTGTNTDVATTRTRCSWPSPLEGTSQGGRSGFVRVRRTENTELNSSLVALREQHP